MTAKKAEPRERDRAEEILKVLEKAELQAWKKQYAYWKSLGEPMSDAALTDEEADLFARLCGAHTGLFRLLKSLRRRGLAPKRKGES